MMKMRVCVLAVLCVLLVAPPLFAQQARIAQEVYKILGISVEGNSLADPPPSSRTPACTVGEEIVVPGDQVAQAVRKLWSLKIFRRRPDRDRPEGRERRLISSSPSRSYPRLRRDDRPGTGRGQRGRHPEEDHRSCAGRSSPPRTLRRIKKEIKKLYEKEGYLLREGRGDHRSPSDTSKNRVNLMVTIDEGKEVEVDQHQVEGNVAFTDGDLDGSHGRDLRNRPGGSSGRPPSSTGRNTRKTRRRSSSSTGRTDTATPQILSDSIWYDARQGGHDASSSASTKGRSTRSAHIAWEGNTVYPASALNERLDDVARGTCTTGKSSSRTCGGTRADRRGVALPRQRVSPVQPGADRDPGGRGLHRSHDPRLSR